MNALAYIITSIASLTTTGLSIVDVSTYTMSSYLSGFVSQIEYTSSIILSSGADGVYGYTT